MKVYRVQYALWVQDLKRNQPICPFKEIAFEVLSNLNFS